MSTDNAELLRTTYEAFGRGDISAVLEVLDENIVWNAPAVLPHAMPVSGRGDVPGSGNGAMSVPKRRARASAAAPFGPIHLRLRAEARRESPLGAVTGHRHRRSSRARRASIKSKVEDDTGQSTSEGHWDPPTRSRPPTHTATAPPHLTGIKVCSATAHLTLL